MSTARPGELAAHEAASVNGARTCRRRPVLRRVMAATGVNAAGLVISIGVFALPLLFILMESLKSNLDFIRNPMGLPKSVTLSNFSAAWTQGELGYQMINSVIYSVVPNVITLVLGVFLAFPISRGYFRFSNALYALFIFSGFLPGALIPLFILARFLHLYNNMIGYLVMQSLAGAGFFFFVGYIRTIPRELDEAAAIDGVGYIRFIFRIIIPEMRPALAAFGIFGFIASWNSLILPIVMLPDKKLWPVTLGLYSFMGEHVQNWPVIAAATVIVALPIVIVFVVLQKNLIEGVAGGAAAGTRGVGGGKVDVGTGT